MSALFLRVWMGATPTVACTAARRRLQDGWTSPSVSYSRRRPRDPDLSRRENRFCNRSGKEPEGAQSYGLHGNVGDGEAKFRATVNLKRVGLHDTMTDIGICDQDNIRCCGQLRGGAQRFRQNHHKTFRIGGRAQRVGVNERTLLSVWVPKSTSSSVPLEGFLRGPRQPIRPSGTIGAKTRSRISKAPVQQFQTMPQQ